jgi:hypothetical protein
MVAPVSSGFSPDLLLAYAKVNSGGSAIANEQVLTLRQAQANAQAESAPEGSTVSRYA